RWLKFKGGKGVATSLGALIALNPPTAGMRLATWLLIFGITRISSLSAVVAALGAPFFAYLMAPQQVLWVALALSALTIVRHLPNIRRLLEGKEGKTQFTLSSRNNS